MKQIILPSTALEFTWLVIDGCMEEVAKPPSPKKEIRTPQIKKVPKKFEIFPAPTYKIQKTNLASHKKSICGKGGVYIMENEDTNTDYHKFFRAGDQKWEIVEIAIRIIFFFCLRFVLLFILGVFKSHLRKSPPCKVPIPTQNPNFPYEQWVRAVIFKATLRNNQIWRHISSNLQTDIK